MNRKTEIHILSVMVCVLLVLLVTVVLLADFPLLSSLRGPSVPRLEKQILPVETTSIAKAPSFQIERRYSGVTRPKRTVDLGFSRPGRVDTVLAELGDAVKEGQNLAMLETRRLELQKKKVDDAFEKGSPQVSKEDVDLIALDLEECALKAPFDGIISQANATIGSMVSAGHPVFRLVENEALEARISLPVDLVEGMAPGDEKTLELRGKNHRSRVKSILPEVDESARTRTVVLTVEAEGTKNAPGHLPGEVVYLDVSRTVGIPGFWVPLPALTRESRGLWSVYTVNGDERVERHYVEVIHVENDRAWVRGTLGENPRLIAQGTHRVVPGQKVREPGEESTAALEEGDSP